MAKSERDEEREERIRMEIIVDAYGPEERAMGWYCYLGDTMEFPFTANCISKRRSSPVKVGGTVEVVGLAPAEECEREIFVEIAWDDATLDVPLMQLQAWEADEDTEEAIADWHYWVERGYEFG